MKLPIYNIKLGPTNVYIFAGQTLIYKHGPHEDSIADFIAMNQEINTNK